VTKSHLAQHGHALAWQELPALVIVLLGGFATYFVSRVFLKLKNHSDHQYTDFRSRDTAEFAAAAGGMTVSFTWTPADTSGASDSWISFEAGLNDFDQQYAVTNGSTDSGILLKNAGGAGTTGVQTFADGSASGTDMGFAEASSHLVSLVYQFNSFADATPVTLTAYVDGSVNATSSFSWNGTGGAQYLALDTNDNTGTSEDISDFSVIAGVPEPSSVGLASSPAADDLPDELWARRVW
jgi:hypothetical protein